MHRGAALVEVFNCDHSHDAVSGSHTAYLEVWSGNNSVSGLVSPPQRPRLAAAGQYLEQMTINIQEFSLVKSGKDCCGPDLIIGSPAMLKLGLGVDAKTAHLCNVKRRLRK